MIDSSERFEISDAEVIEYEITELPESGHKFRGPLPERLETGSFFSVLGSAQTFGRFCERPYPSLLAQNIGLPAVNMGVAGAGPEFFMRDDRLINVLNRSKFVILQVMSARSQSNSYYGCGGLSVATLRHDGRQISADAAFDELMRGHPLLERLPLPARVRRKIGNLSSRQATRALVAEIRSAWVTSNVDLVRRIEVPVILLWFSKRGPAYKEDYASRGKLFGETPFLVTDEMIAQIVPHVADYVECVTRRGSPQKLCSRFTGLPVMGPQPENHFYPSPEMHDDAARALSGACLRLM